MLSAANIDLPQCLNLSTGKMHPPSKPNFFVVVVYFTRLLWCLTETNECFVQNLPTSETRDESLLLTVR